MPSTSARPAEGAIEEPVEEPIEEDGARRRGKAAPRMEAWTATRPDGTRVNVVRNIDTGVQTVEPAG